MQATVCLLITLGAIVGAAPPAPVNNNNCGDPYGRCYKPINIVQRAPSVTTAPPPPRATDDCRTRTICIDAINSCGIRYGGCVPDCKPYAIKTPSCPPSPPKTVDDGWMTAWKEHDGTMTAWAPQPTQ